MASNRRSSTTDNAGGETFPAFDASEDATPQPGDSFPGGLVASFIPERIRRGTNWLLEQEIPRGASQAVAQTVAQAPTLTEVRQGAYTTAGEERYQQFENGDTPSDLSTRRREASGGAYSSRRASTTAAAPQRQQQQQQQRQQAQDTSPIEDLEGAKMATKSKNSSSPLTRFETVNDLHLTASGTFPNGYKFPPKHTWKEATAIGFKAFVRFTFGSIFGFLLVIYALNVVAWGGMIFLLLCGAGNKYMCTGYFVDHCSSKYAKKSFWIEVDAQVLTALFCVTAFGLLPWRARDLYYLMQFRLQHKHIALRRLAAAHKGWFRLPGSHHLDPLVKVPSPPDPEAERYLPYPLEKGAEAPLTGVRAHDTALWKMDVVVWLMMLNSVFQVPLCGVMWGLNRFNRPSWTTALLIVLGMLSAMAAGILQLVEGKKVKAREGIPLSQADLGKLAALDEAAHAHGGGVDVEKGAVRQAPVELKVSSPTEGGVESGTEGAR